MYTDEELELLRSDPELIALQYDIRNDRLRQEEAEVAELERQRELDDAIESPLRRLREKGRVWAEWSAQWWDHTAYDRALQQGIELLAEVLLWVEDEELTERERFEEEWQREWEHIHQTERTRYRVITEWLTVWEEGRDTQWATERHAHTSAVERTLWYMSHGAAADAAEIAKWEEEERTITERIQAKQRKTGDKALNE